MSCSTAYFAQQSAGLKEWREFYVIVGSGAAALTAVMFIVASLRTQAMAARTKDSVRAFVTPTVVFFLSVLLLSGLMTVPAISRAVLGTLLGLGGLGALGYLIAIKGHQRWRKSRSKLGLEDWTFYIGLPFLAYLLLLASGVAVWKEAALALEMVAVTAMLLLAVGTHNAWDLVLWMTEQPRD